MNLIIRLLITAVSAFLLQKVLGGVHIDSLGTAIVFAIVLGAFNLLIRPVLQLIGLPLTILTLGLFALVINAVVVLMADYFVEGMSIDGFWWALGFSILLSFVTSALNSLILKD